jgi:tetratricopeptide (TPR) repeat protein
VTDRLFATLLCALLLVPIGAARSARADAPTERRVAALRARLDRLPADTTTRLDLADLLERAGRTDEALAELDFVDALAPDDPVAAATRARALVRAGRTGEALEVLDRLLERSEGLPAAHALRAELLEELGRLADALAEREAVLESAPTVQARLDHGRLLERLGRIGDAAASYERGVAAHDGASPLRMAAIDAHRRLGHPERALVHADALIAAAQVAPRWRVLKADLLDAMHRSVEARAERERALADAERMLARRRSPLALLERGRALLALGRTEEAARDLRQSLLRAPDQPEARVLLARAGAR